LILITLRVAVLHSHKMAVVHAKGVEALQCHVNVSLLLTSY